jgi:hypothetical protein
MSFGFISTPACLLAALVLSPLVCPRLGSSANDYSDLVPTLYNELSASINITALQHPLLQLRPELSVVVDGRAV